MYYIMDKILENIDLIYKRKNTIEKLQKATEVINPPKLEGPTKVENKYKTVIPGKLETKSFGYLETPEPWKLLNQPKPRQQLIRGKGQAKVYINPKHLHHSVFSYQHQESFKNFINEMKKETQCTNIDFENTNKDLADVEIIPIFESGSRIDQKVMTLIQNDDIEHKRRLIILVCLITSKTTMQYLEQFTNIFDYMFFLITDDTFVNIFPDKGKMWEICNVIKNGVQKIQ